MKIGELWSQCTTSNFSINPSACIQENLNVTNQTSGTSLSFEWDFCEGDLKLTPASSQLTTLTGASSPRGFEIVEDNGVWFAFATSRDNNSLFRISFGSNLNNNSPVIENLGNIGNLLSTPEDIKFFRESGNWYGLIFNRGDNSILRIGFGTDLGIEANDLIVEHAVTGVGGANSRFDLSFDQSNIVVLLTNFSGNTITQIDFGSSILNNPSPVDIYSTSVIINGIIDIDIFENCGNWYGIVISYLGRTAYLLDFGGSLLADPSTLLLENNTLFGTDLLSNSSVLVDESEFVFLLSTEGGNLYRLNIGTDPSTPVVSSDLVGDLGDFTWAHDFAKTESDWIGFNLSFVSRSISRIVFPNPCEANIATSFSEDPVVRYEDSGNFKIGLRAEDSNGSTSYSVQSINVSDDVAPSISMSIDPSRCISNSNTFTPSNVGLSSYTWNFGDGSPTTNTISPTHTFGATGTYTIRLGVNDGTCDNFVEQEITIYPNPPTPDFTVVSDECVNTSISFVNNTDESQHTGILMYKWDFDNDGNIDSTDPEPTFSYSTPGVKTVSLVDSIPGCASSATTFDITISPGPTSAFTASSFNVCQGETIAFTNQSTGSPVSLDWDFGDSFTSTTENPSHLFATAGNFDVSLMTTDALGCESTLVREVSVSALPVVSFDFDVPCTSVEGIQFTDLSTVDGADIVSRTWFVDNVEVSSLQNPSIVFESEGTVNVRLETLSSNGCEASYNEDISVLNSPQPSFSIDLGCQGETSTFVDITNSPGNPIISWLWDVNGTSYTNEVVNHTFLSPGIFDVTLEVTAQNFCSETFTRSVEILELPSLNFSVVGDCSNEIIQLEDQSTIFQDPIVSREWRLNGSAVGNGSELFLSELQDDTYDLQLEVVTQSGCITNASQELVISTAPMASISASKTFGIPGDQILFTDNSLESSEKQWLLNGELLSNEGSTQSLTFPDPGIHRVSVVANNSLGCSDTSTADILIAIPEVDLSIGQFDLIENGNSGSIFLEIENNSNLPVEVTEVVIELENQFSITEQVLAPIGINESQLVNLNVGIPLTNSELTYLCVSLNSQYTDYLDLTPIDNEKCIALEPEVVVEAPFPNPTSGQSRVRVIVPEPSEAIMTLLNPSGKVETSSFQNLNPGLNNFFFDLQDLESGIYLVKVEVLGRISIQRIIKL